MNPTWVLTAGLLAAPGAWAAEAPPAPPPPPLSELNRQMDQVIGQLRNSDDNIRVVETQYSQRSDVSAEERMTRHFSDGEIQFLLGDYRTASVLFYDLVSDAAFHASARYPDALYYLSESLYQQGNLLGARLYLRDLLGRDTGHYKEALGRYLDIASRLNELEDVDNYVAKARELGGGRLPDEVTYVYGKSILRRTGLSQEERIQRAAPLFETLAAAPSGPYRLQSKYFLAVMDVEARRLDEAQTKFEALVKENAGSDKDLQVRELANLSLGRLLYENGKLDAAIDRYQEIPRESDYFPDSIYEVAWAKVKKNDYEGANNATELLGLVAPESTLKPESDILHAHLLLKLQKYDEASDTYDSVRANYAPVKDQIDTLLSANHDPVSYFDSILSGRDKSTNVDVGALLPPLAVKWANTQHEVADAVRMVNDIDNGHHGVEESDLIARHILDALAQRGIEAFPALQEGYTRADAISSSLTKSDEALLKIETLLVDRLLTPSEREQLAALKTQMSGLQKRVDTIPTNEEELKVRRGRIDDRVGEIDKDVFKLGYELQSMSAMVAAIRKWVTDTRGERTNTPEDERAFGEKVTHESKAIDGIMSEVDELRAQLRVERATAAAGISGEGALRAQLQALLEQERQTLAGVEARLDPESAPLAKRATEGHEQVGLLQKRVSSSKEALDGKVTKLGQEMRDKVAAEQGLLRGYDHDVDHVSTDARQLVGRIAFDSIKRVRHQFYDLVLKADVGTVDVAFTKKQDQTAEIQKMSSEKDHQLRTLDEEFKEVLKDVD